MDIAFFRLSQMVIYLDQIYHNLLIHYLPTRYNYFKICSNNVANAFNEMVGKEKCHFLSRWFFTSYQFSFLDPWAFLSLPQLPRFHKVRRWNWTPNHANNPSSASSDLHLWSRLKLFLYNLHRTWYTWNDHSRRQVSPMQSWKSERKKLEQ